MSRYSKTQSGDAQTKNVVAKPPQSEYSKWMYAAADGTVTVAKSIAAMLADNGVTA